MTASTADAAPQIGKIVYVQSEEKHSPSGLTLVTIKEVRVTNTYPDFSVVCGNLLNSFTYFEKYPEKGSFIPFAISSGIRADGEPISLLVDGSHSGKLVEKPAQFDGIASSNYFPPVLP